jgi:hypothetical protein
VTDRTLYIRGVPENVVRRAKAAAAREGLTLTAFVVRALVQATGGEETYGGESSIRDDMAWFEANSDDLMSRYSGEYVAIIDGRVVDHSRSFNGLARRVFDRYGVRPIYMPKCGVGGTVSVRAPRVERE